MIYLEWKDEPAPTGAYSSIWHTLHVGCRACKYADVYGGGDEAAREKVEEVLLSLAMRSAAGAKCEHMEGYLQGLKELVGGHNSEYWLLLLKKCKEETRIVRVPIRKRRQRSARA